MRVTNSMVVRSTLYDLNQTLGRLQESQADLSTGRRIRRASDDPAGATASMTLRQQLRRHEQRERSLTDTQAWLGTADSALVGGLDMLARVKELTVRAANTGAAGATSLGALASEVGNIRDELLAVANSKYLDRSIFNGTAAGDAYDVTTGAFLGNAAAIRREVAPGTTVQANLTGEEVFGTQAAPEGDLFAVLDRLSSAIAAGDTAAIGTEHANLDAATKRMASAAAEIGSRGARLEAIRSRAAADEVSLRETLSELEDTDIAEALITVKARENAYTAALQSASRVIPPSLLDFLH